MAGHLACIGVETEDEFVRVVERAAEEGKRLHAEDGEEIVWRDEGGASMLSISARIARSCAPGRASTPRRGWTCG